MFLDYSLRILQLKHETKNVLFYARQKGNAYPEMNKKGIESYTACRRSTVHTSMHKFIVNLLLTDIYIKNRHIMKHRSSTGCTLFALPRVFRFYFDDVPSCELEHRMYCVAFAFLMKNFNVDAFDCYKYPNRLKSFVQLSVFIEFRKYAERVLHTA